MSRAQVRLAFYGLSGAGKSTAAGFVTDTLAAVGLPVRVVKISEPMLRIQREVYAVMGRPLRSGGSDQVLLRAVAAQFRRIDPQFLAVDLLRRVDAAAEQVVITDDLREKADMPVLAAAGFRFCHVGCEQETRLSRLAQRPDPSQQTETAQTWRHHEVSPDWSIDNSGDRDELRRQVTGMLRDLLARSGRPRPVRGHPGLTSPALHEGVTGG